MLTAIILTRDEELHIARAITSVRPVAERIVVVDSGSTDNTCRIAADLGAVVLSRPWRNYADQFNWAIEQVQDQTNWIFRLDADEVVSPELCDEINQTLPLLAPETAGIYVPRYMTFQGAPVRWGGVFPIHVLRLFRPSAGRCEVRWMDEHIRVQGAVVQFKGALVDDNLKPLNWWMDKHDAYAAREVVDLMNLKHGFLPMTSIADPAAGQAGRKRWIKEVIYARLPKRLRAGGYFVWRYFVRLGCLDSPKARKFHKLQGFWYRNLVDQKLHAVETYMRVQSVGPPSAIRDVLGIDVTRK